MLSNLNNHVIHCSVYFTDCKDYERFLYSKKSVHFVNKLQNSLLSISIMYVLFYNCIYSEV